jgi:hypothetical protein
LPIHRHYLFPFLRFLNRHRRTKTLIPNLCVDTWKVPYFFGPNQPRTLKEREKYQEFRAWIFENTHYVRWLRTPESMYAPRQYMIPELRKILIVTPRYFGAHFFPSYHSDLLFDLTEDKKKRLKKSFPYEGLEYLVAYCHGVSMSLMCRWSGNTEADIHKKILNSVESFANNLSYWIWAYRVDMQSIPFTQKKNSKSRFRNRLDTWTRLSSHPQFVLPHHTQIFLPNYLQTPEALSCLPKKTTKKPIDRLLLTAPKSRKLPPRKLFRYK